jgi:hypothetical protein
MNVALLNDYEIDIDRVSKELEEMGYKRSEVKNQLNERYRRFSQKGNFRCICCDERVEMVLANDKAFHFRHYDKERCAYSENYKTYTNQKESLEDAPKHRAGKAIIRTYLEGTCKTNDIKFSDGYYYKDVLSFVPDFILEFPSGQRWAIDYITGLKNDRKYANSLDKRRNTYVQNDFIPIFLFDSYWLAYEPDIHHISLVDGEILFVGHTTQDDLWTEFIEGLDPTLKNILFNSRSYSHQVKSMTYIAPHEREIKIIRFLHEKFDPKKTRTLVKPISLPFEQALAIKNDQTSFSYLSQEEDVYREELRRQLEEISQEEERIRNQRELERRKREEEVERQKELARVLGEERKKQQDVQRTNEYIDYTKSVPFTGRTQQQMNADMRREMEFLDRRNSAKEPYWYRQVVQHMTKYYNSEYENQQTKVDPAPVVEPKNNIASKLPDWKLDEILNHYVNGEAYFTGESRKWKEVVLNSYELIHTGRISIPQLLQKIQDQGIECKQPEKIMAYPIREYLEFIGKKVKKDVLLGRG